MAIIISNKSTNFVGRAKKMNHSRTNDKAKIENDLDEKKIVWKSIISGAPHFGGIWEILVQSCQKVIIAILDGKFHK